ncbi:MAG: CCA tRNA nucleotidyltransferase [Gemmataceae bacterium]
MSEREFALDVVRRLQEAGHEALFAGGCVRDELLGLVPKDYDIATAALPDQVRGLFRRSLAVGEAFGVVEVLGPKPLRVQVATFRRDGPYSDGRRPDEVVFSSAQEDARRRDFTINGMFYDPLRDKVIDFVGGRDDLQRRLLRAIGDPHQRFAEDRLRLLRAVRMAARFACTIEPATWEAIRQRAATLGQGVSAERIHDELRKMIADPHRSIALQLMVEAGLAAVILPEWDASTLPLLDRLPEPSFVLALAVLLHPLGTKVARQVAQRLRLSNDDRERLEWLVAHAEHLQDIATLRPARLKPLLTHPAADELLELTRARGFVAEAEAASERRAIWLAQGSLNPAPLVTGNDLVALGLRPGPAFKQLLSEIRDAQLDGELHTPEQALARVRQQLGLSQSQE